MRTSRQSGVTLIELAVLIVWFGLGCAGAAWGGIRYGWVGGIAGFVGGLTVPAGLVQSGGYAYFCRCGGRYRKTGRRFMEEIPDGSLRPYMIWRAFRGWFPESQ